MNKKSYIGKNKTNNELKTYVSTAEKEDQDQINILTNKVIALEQSNKELQEERKVKPFADVCMALIIFMPSLVSKKIYYLLSDKFNISLLTVIMILVALIYEIFIIVYYKKIHKKFSDLAKEFIGNKQDEDQNKTA